MKLRNIKIHNFRSIKDATIKALPYTLIVGENNAGKTNLVSALRMFYEDGGLKYQRERDFPKYQTDDADSWVELSFDTTQDEQDGLKKEYQTPDRVLRVRRYLESDAGLAKANQSNIYAYENGTLSSNLFYGAKNISQAKLGRVIYVPAAGKLDDTFKLTGPSPFRELVNLVMKKAMQDSGSYSNLQKAFETFNDEFRKEEESSGLSISSLVDDINLHIKHWGVGFGIDINPIKPDDIVKSLLSHHLKDEGLGDHKVDISAFGQGLQRHLIYTLIRLSSKYATKSAPTKKEFSPEFSLLLFEEPEAFLHPTQQEVLFQSLQDLSQQDDQQVIVTSHSSKFVSKQIEKLPGLIRVQKNQARTETYQLDDGTLKAMLSDNLAPARVLGEDKNPDFDEDEKISEEMLHYFLWLDTERSEAFFAKHVFICEGASEKVFIDYLVDKRWTDLRERHVYFLDALGKYNIHRFMHLLTTLGIRHSVIHDKDEGRKNHAVWNACIDKSRSACTSAVHMFTEDFETFLGVPKAGRPNLKPMNVIKRFNAGEIQPQRIDELEAIVRGHLA